MGLNCEFRIPAAGKPLFRRDRGILRIARALFDKYDADGSGHLSYNEFADALLTHR